MVNENKDNSIFTYIREWLWFYLHIYSIHLMMFLAYQGKQFQSTDYCCWKGWMESHLQEFLGDSMKGRWKVKLTSRKLAATAFNFIRNRTNKNRTNIHNVKNYIWNRIYCYNNFLLEAAQGIWRAETRRSTGQYISRSVWVLFVWNLEPNHLDRWIYEVAIVCFMSTSNFLVLHDKYLQELPLLGLINDYNTFHLFEAFVFSLYFKISQHRFVSLGVFQEVLHRYILLTAFIKSETWFPIDIVIFQKKIKQILLITAYLLSITLTMKVR